MKTSLLQHQSAPGSVLPRWAPLFVLSSLVLAAPAIASDRWATLEAIHQLENPHDSVSPGSCGELGAYQFREGTWRMYTRMPFRRALDRRSSDAVAVLHYDRIKAELESRGIEATPYRIALAWNGGLRAALEMNPPLAAVDYARRAANLASEFGRNQLAYAR